MSAKLKMSSKGQIVVPLKMRRRHGWSAGSEIEVVDTAAGVTLCGAVDARAGLSIEEALARIRARASYTGPPLSIEEMGLSVLEMAERQDRRSR